MNPFLGSGQDLSFIAPTFAADTDTVSQEFRVAGEMERMRWLAGAYYFDNEVNGNYTLNTDAIGFVRMDARYTQQTDSIDLFGQVEYDLADSLTLIAGLRWTSEDKELDFRNIDSSGITAFCSTEPGPPGRGLLQPGAHADQPVTGRRRTT